jgi:hypothetical protein
MWGLPSACARMVNRVNTSLWQGMRHKQYTHLLHNLISWLSIVHLRSRESTTNVLECVGLCVWESVCNAEDNDHTHSEHMLCQHGVVIEHMKYVLCALVGHPFAYVFRLAFLC